ncbi:phospholipase effector Tle1 domain-containing protein [Bradyrhizobium sp. DASA03068]|uniref:phospholipase effector Tle1 domain-containing protein n=1 Tax=Bradyrhizobium sp. BLXBL-01 TaxID=3395915 RepID=UPI003F6F2DE4
MYLDGTWNSVDSNTNVWRMRALTAAKSGNDKPQFVYYSVGVNGALGGMFGQGLDDNIRLAYEWLIENYNDGDEIFIFGFSRGAYTARALAGLIAIDGILKAGSPIGVAELFERYRKGDEETIWKLRDMQSSGDADKLTEQQRWLLKYSQPADVKMIGIWDTVGLVGLAAGNIAGISRSQFEYLQPGLCIHILNGYHALAVHEHRNDFAPTLGTVRHPKDPKAVIAPPRPTSGVEQRWFVGAHANVGGGYETDLLNQAPLRWLMKKAESHGLAFRTDVELEGDSVTAPIAGSYGKFGYGI